MLENNYHKWTILAKTISPSTNGVATFYVNSRPYAVRVLRYTVDDLPILSVSINEGLPRTWIGINGYFYTPNDELLMLSSPYKIKQLTEHIYCYWR